MFVMTCLPRLSPSTLEAIWANSSEDTVSCRLYSSLPHKHTLGIKKLYLLDFSFFLFSIFIFLCVCVSQTHIFMFQNKQTLPALIMFWLGTAVLCECQLPGGTRDILLLQTYCSALAVKFKQLILRYIVIYTKSLYISAENTKNF